MFMSYVNGFLITPPFYTCRMAKSIVFFYICRIFSTFVEFTIRRYVYSTYKWRGLFQFSG